MSKSDSSRLNIESGSTGTDSVVITVSYQEDTGSITRIGKITVTATGATNSPQFVEIIQSDAGDIDRSGVTDLGDAVIALKVVVGMNPSSAYADADINGDGKIGLEEAVFILQKLAGIKE